MVCFLGDTKVEEVIRMSDYELLMLVFTIVALLFAVYKQGKDDR